MLTGADATFTDGYDYVPNNLLKTNYIEYHQIPDKRDDDEDEFCYTTSSGQDGTDHTGDFVTVYWDEPRVVTSFLFKTFKDRNSRELEGMDIYIDDVYCMEISRRAFCDFDYGFSRL